jgi:hypothetical protein
MDAFARTLTERRSFVAGRANILHFSDSAFIEVEDDIEAKVRFLALLNATRVSLFERGFFFKCAIVPGGLDVAVSSSARLSSYVFKNLAGVHAYELHESFKGIGCVVDTACVRDFERALESPTKRKTVYEVAEALNSAFLVQKSLGSKTVGHSPFVRSFFLPSQEHIEPIESYYDLRLPPVVTQLRGGLDLSFQPGFFEDGGSDTDFDAETSGLLDKILLKFAKAKTKSHSYGRYYLPLLGAIAESSDLSLVSMAEEEKVPTGPPLVAGVFRRDILKAFEDVAGIGLIPLRLIDLALGRVQDDRPVRRRLLMYFARWSTSRRFVRDALRLRIPAELVREQTKDELLEEMARIAMGPT